MPGILELLDQLRRAGILAVIQYPVGRDIADITVAGCRSLNPGGRDIEDFTVDGCRSLNPGGRDIDVKTHIHYCRLL